MLASHTLKGNSFVANKPRLWSDNQIGGGVSSVKNIDLALYGKRIVVLMPSSEAKG